MLVTVGGNGGDLSNLLGGGDLALVLTQEADNGVNGGLGTFFLRSIGLQPAATFLTDSVKIARPRTVAEVVPSPQTRWSWRQPPAGDGHQVLELVLQVDGLGNGNTILGDLGSTKGLLNKNIATLGAEGNRDSLGQSVNTL